MHTRLSRSLYFAAAGLILAACSNDDSTDVLLVVQAAQEQPSKDEAGIIVAIQSLGGRWLELSVTGGTLGTAACLPAPTGSVLSARITNTIVFPDQTEAVITVSLLPDGPKVGSDEDEEAAGASGSGVIEKPEVGACGVAAEPLLQVIRPIQRVNAQNPLLGVAGAGGTSPAGGAGGAGGAAGGGGLAGSGGKGLGGASGESGSAGEAGSDAGTGGQP